MVGVTYRSSSARPASHKAGGSMRIPPPSQPQEEVTPAGPALSFKDKDSYQELFKPLPKPEPIPTLGSSLTVEAKSWRQLQDEREALMSKQIEGTKNEAMSLWGRAKEEDSKGMKRDWRRTEPGNWRSRDRRNYFMEGQ